MRFYSGKSAVTSPAKRGSNPVQMWFLWRRIQLRLVLSEGVSVDVDVESAGACFVRAVAEAQGFLHYSLPVHLVLMIVKSHRMRHDP